MPHWKNVCSLNFEQNFCQNSLSALCMRHLAATRQNDRIEKQEWRHRLLGRITKSNVTINSVSCWPSLTSSSPLAATLEASLQPDRRRASFAGSRDKSDAELPKSKVNLSPELLDVIEDHHWRIESDVIQDTKLCSRVEQLASTSNPVEIVHWTNLNSEYYSAELKDTLKHLWASCLLNSWKIAWFQGVF